MPQGIVAGMYTRVYPTENIRRKTISYDHGLLTIRVIHPRKAGVKKLHRRLMSPHPFGDKYTVKIFRNTAMLYSPVLNECGTVRGYIQSVGYDVADFWE